MSILALQLNSTLNSNIYSNLQFQSSVEKSFVHLGKKVTIKLQRHQFTGIGNNEEQLSAIENALKQLMLLMIMLERLSNPNRFQKFIATQILHKLPQNKQIKNLWLTPPREVEGKQTKKKNLHHIASIYINGNKTPLNLWIESII